MAFTIRIGETIEVGADNLEDTVALIRALRADGGVARQLALAPMPASEPPPPQARRVKKVNVPTEGKQTARGDKIVAELEACSSRFDELTDAMRKVCELRIGGKQPKEIARLTGKSEVAVSTIIWTVRKRMSAGRTAGARSAGAGIRTAASDDDAEPDGEDVRDWSEFATGDEPDTSNIGPEPNGESIGRVLVAVPELPQIQSIEATGYTETEQKMRRKLCEEVGAGRIDVVHLPIVRETDQIPRPRTRGDCVDGPRPCPWVGCRHHLLLDVHQVTGHIRFNFGALEPEEIPETCSLDVADRGGITLEEVGATINLTRERVRQIEVRGLMAAQEDLANTERPEDIDHDSPMARLQAVG